MELAQIRETLRSQPFRSFTMRLVDGREFVVPHRDSVFVPPNMRHTVLFANPATEAVTILDAIMIASITFNENGSRETEGPAGNGEQPPAR